MPSFKPLTLTALIAGIMSVGAMSAHAQTNKPNIVVIMADDLGWTDIGAYGGEVKTPNLDALAKQGVKFSNFQVTPYSAPSRAAFLTGADPHEVGLGNLIELNTPEQSKNPGYVGHLNDKAYTIAQRLQQAGYRTILSGKWHLGTSEEDSPANWGFDDSFAMLRGEANHFRRVDVEPSPDGADIYRLNGKLTDIP